jgi:hypothetical protein
MSQTTFLVLRSTISAEPTSPAASPCSRLSTQLSTGNEPSQDFGQANGTGCVFRADFRRRMRLALQQDRPGYGDVLSSRPNRRQASQPMPSPSASSP